MDPGAIYADRLHDPDLIWGVMTRDLLWPGAVGLMLVGVLSVEQAYRSVNWTKVILIGAMTPLSAAMSETGAAQLLADKLVGAVGGAGPFALLAGLFVLTAVLGQLISNTATALILIPIGAAAALELGLSPQPVLMSICIAAAASFLTPVATPVNLMIMGPGGYKFSDYWKLGICCIAFFKRKISEGQCCSFGW